MKAILVIDMPDNCEECCCAYYTEGVHHNYCQAVGYETNIEGYQKEPNIFCSIDSGRYRGKKPSWCPLKPLPKKVDINLKEDEVERVFKKHYWEKDEWGILNFKKTLKYAFISGYKRCIKELILGEEQ